MPANEMLTGWAIAIGLVALVVLLRHEPRQQGPVQHPRRHGWHVERARSCGCSWLINPRGRPMGALICRSCEQRLAECAPLLLHDMDPRRN